MSKMIDNYLILEKIGSGQYGSVHKAQCLKTNQMVAIKVMKSEKFKAVPKLQEFILNQIQILSKIKNPNVIRFIQMLRTVNNFYLVYQYCSGGTLEDVIKSKKCLKEKEAIVVLEQILHAFKELFHKNILHRDLKPSNILLHNDVIKVADFGFCKGLQNQQDLTQTMVGSPIYMAPQVLKGSTYNLKADIWSIGVVLFEMLFGFCPFQDKTIAKLIMQIDNKPLLIPKTNPISPKIQKLLRKMLTIDVKERIQWSQILSYDLSTEAKPEKIITLSPSAFKKRREQQRDSSPIAKERSKSKSPDFRNNKRPISIVNNLGTKFEKNGPASLRPKENLLRSKGEQERYSSIRVPTSQKQNQTAQANLKLRRVAIQQLIATVKEVLTTNSLGTMVLPTVFMVCKVCLQYIKAFSRDQFKKHYGLQSPDQKLTSFLRNQKAMLETYLKNVVKNIPYVGLPLRLEIQNQIIDKGFFWGVIENGMALTKSVKLKKGLLNAYLLYSKLEAVLDQKSISLPERVGTEQEEERGEAAIEELARMISQGLSQKSIG